MADWELYGSQNISTPEITRYIGLERDYGYDFTFYYYDDIDTSVSPYEPAGGKLGEYTFNIEDGLDDNIYKYRFYVKASSTQILDEVIDKQRFDSLYATEFIASIAAYLSSFTLYVYRMPINKVPTITLDTTDNRTLYENDTYNISGTAQDSDAGDVVTVRYSINNGQERAIDTRISDGSSFSFNHTLTFRQGRLYRNDTAVTGELAEGSEHVLRVWVEDDNGGQSEVVQRSFYVVPNRMPELTVEPFGSRTDLIDSDKITFRGEASDPDGNDITVSYKINNGSYQQVYSGQGGAFEFQVAVGDLNNGENNVTIRSQDSYGAEVQKVLRVNKSGESVPLKTAVERYKIIPPNGTAKGVVLWLQRETGDLIANARIHMGTNGDPENFQDMTLEATSFVEDGIEEDEWTFDNGEEAENIILEITMERNSTSSNEGIKLINGVLS